MKNLQEATERICELRGSLIALDAVLAALVRTLAPDAREKWLESFKDAADVASTILMNSDISEVTIDALERDASRWIRLLRAPSQPAQCVHEVGTLLSGVKR